MQLLLLWCQISVNTASRGSLQATHLLLDLLSACDLQRASAVKHGGISPCDPNVDFARGKIATWIEHVCKCVWGGIVWCNLNGKGLVYSILATPLRVCRVASEHVNSSQVASSCKLFTYHHDSPLSTSESIHIYPKRNKSKDTYTIIQS